MEYIALKITLHFKTKPKFRFCLQSIQAVSQVTD